PMQWRPGPGAGFTDGEPWLPLTADHGTRNVAVQRDDAGSMLRLHRHLIRLRARHPALVRGGYRPLPGQGPVLAFLREEEDGRRPADGRGHDRVMVLVNFDAEPADYTPPFEWAGEVVLSSRADAPAVPGDPAGRIRLAGYEAVVMALAGAAPPGTARG
ncbi:MAG: DUF3459 domain-containing protein, partial [Gemmatimonadota bacterium]